MTQHNTTEKLKKRESVIYLIKYDKVLGRSTGKLQKALENCGVSGWWHHMQDTWLVDTPENANQIYEKLKRYIEKDERIFIIRIDPIADQQGYLPPEAWNWIKERQIYRHP